MKNDERYMQFLEQMKVTQEDKKVAYEIAMEIVDCIADRKVNLLIAEMALNIAKDGVKTTLALKKITQEI